MTDAGDIGVDKLQMLVLERTQAGCERARFYVLAIEPPLFGDTAPVRPRGRIGATGRRRLDLHADDGRAAETLNVWLKRKTRRRYQVRASRPRS